MRRWEDLHICWLRTIVTTLYSGWCPRIGSAGLPEKGVSVADSITFVIFPLY
jgi:hypothetical protein